MKHKEHRTSPAPVHPAAAHSGGGAPGTPSPPPGRPAAAAAPVVPEVLSISASVESPLYRAKVISAAGISRSGSSSIVARSPDHSWLIRPHRPHRGACGRARPDTGHSSSGADRVRRDQEKPDGELRLSGEDGFGLRISETMRFRADNYTVERLIRVENRNPAAQTADLLLAWRTPVEWPKDRAELFQGQHPIRGRGTCRRDCARGSRRRDDPPRRRHLDRARERVVSSALIPRARASSWSRPSSTARGADGVRATLPTSSPAKRGKAPC